MSADALTELTRAGPLQIDGEILVGRTLAHCCMRQRRASPVYVDMRACVFVLLALLALVGCTPSPSDTCKRLDGLATSEPSGFQLSMDKCLARMNEMKERDPDAYKCAARTIARVTSIDTALLAVSVCDAGKR